MIKPYIDSTYAGYCDDVVNIIIGEVHKKNGTTKQEIVKALIRLKFYRWAVYMPHLLLHDSLDEWVELVMADLAYYR